MSSILAIVILVAMIGSGLAILVFFGEYGRWTMCAFLTMCVFSGAIILVWGMYHMVMGDMYQTLR